jgi:phosphopantothenoylcysteine decarboxylase/phosphopantothenate--cysteine ligase
VGEKFKMKNIVLGVTGSIATYKAADLVRLLVKADFKVKVVMTENAKHRVYDNLFDPEINPMMHIELARWADAVLIAPASASILGKLAAGIADDLLTTVCLATRANMIVAPAMNKEMWANAIVEDNVKKLQEQYHYEILFPEIGEQACGDFGAGRLIENEKIVAFLENKNSGILKGLKVLITAGPTQEAIDPVRYISNHSSGKMGYALAEAAQRFGAKVTLISGPTALTSPAVNQFLPVITAEGMNTAVMENVKNCDIFISTAAVADYKPKEVAKNKIKKSEAAFTLSLEKTIDILSAVSALPKKPFIVGFAAETENLIENATQKLKKKNLDMIIANLITPAGAPFNADENEVILLEKDKTPEHLPRTEKSKLAQKILEKIALSLGVKS